MWRRLLCCNGPVHARSGTGLLQPVLLCGQVAKGLPCKRHLSPAVFGSATARAATATPQPYSAVDFDPAPYAAQLVLNQSNQQQSTQRNFVGSGNILAPHQK